MAFVSSVFSRPVSLVSTLIGAVMVLAACSGEKTVVNNITAQCGPGTRIEGNTCVAIGAGDDAGTSSSSGGSSSSSGATSSSSGAAPDAGDSGPKLPAGCPTEVTDPAAKLLYINCDPACGGDIELCRRGSGPYGQMLCRPATEPKVMIDKLERLPEVGLGTPWRRVLVRLPKDPVTVYGACDPQGLEMNIPGEFAWRRQPATAVFVRVARYKPIEKEQWFTVKPDTFFSTILKFQSCASCAESSPDPMPPMYRAAPSACAEYDSEPWSRPDQGFGRVSQGLIFFTDELSRDARTLEVSNGKNCGAMP
jgi:hypothetical protein